MYQIVIFLLPILFHKSLFLKTPEKTTSQLFGERFYDGKKIVLPLSKNASIQLLNHWIQQATSSFLAAFANKRIKRFSSQNNGEQFQYCSKEANSIPKHAKCVLDLLMLEKKQKSMSYKFGHAKQTFEKLKQYSNKKIRLRRLDPKSSWNQRYVPGVANLKEKFPMLQQKSANDGKMKWKIKRVNKNSYQLLSEHDTKTTFGIIVNGIKGTLQKLKNQNTSNKPWWKIMADIQYLVEKMKKRKELLKIFETKAQDNGINLSRLQKTLISPRTNARLQDDRILLAKSLSKLLRDGALLVAAMSNQNISKFHNKTIRIASPRLFSVLPDDDTQNTMKFLSPSLLSLHNDGKNLEQKLSIPSLLGASNLFNEQDQNELLELISEASGLTDSIEKIHKKLEMESDNMRNAKGIDGQPLYFTKKNVSELYGEIESNKVDTFEKLYKTLNKRQIGEMNATGYAVLNKMQLKLIYGQESPYHHSVALKRFLKLLNKNDGLQKAFENDLKKLAKSGNFGLETGELHQRQKRFGISLSPFLLSPFIFAAKALSQPVLLSPVVLSPVVLSPAVLGPFILSPWLFNPTILSPRLLAPFILNPFIFSPIVLSPVALHPFILSPGIFNPVILSPLALSPFILSPQVATPLILSPMILNPLLFNPMALSPLLFSPFVLSPIIYSPQYFSALFFSPYLLSPIIGSELINTTVIMSPSILC